MLMTQPVRSRSGYSLRVFGLTMEKLVIIAVIAVFLIGPGRLPKYAAMLGQWARNLRNMATNATEKMREELGPEFDDVDWRKLDPRQYDPRRIIRDALLDDEPAPTLSRPAKSTRLDDGALPPFDSEAT
ncbi:twin-arginine translocase TatA/TatE family subunit [Humibacter ginsengiterrae]